MHDTYYTDSIKYQSIQKAEAGLSGPVGGNMRRARMTLIGLPLALLIVLGTFMPMVSTGPAGGLAPPTVYAASCVSSTDAVLKAL